MNPRARAYLDLVRLPNIFTSAADAIAGFLYVGGVGSDWPVLLALAGASSCFYAGGAAFNDVCDADRDRRERPQRPIPSGRVSKRAAVRLVIVLLGFGFCCAVQLGGRAASIAVLLVLSILLYDVVNRSRFVSPALMGSCRAFNLMLAMSGSSSLFRADVIMPVVLMWAYVTSLTLLARDEAKLSGAVRVSGCAMGVFIASAGLWGLLLVVKNASTYFVGCVGALVVFTGGNALVVVRDPSPKTVQTVVRNLVLGIILFDTCIVAASRGLVPSLMVACMAIPAVLSARFIRVT